MSWRHRRQLDAETRILSALDLAGDWAYSLDLMRACKMRSGRYYPTMDTLESAGLVESKWDESEPNVKHRRRMYRLVQHDPR